MNEQQREPSETLLVAPRKSIGRVLLKWFCLLAITPLIMESCVSYQQSSQIMIQQATDNLRQSSSLTGQFVNNWFDYRVMDLQSQAEAQSNMRFIQSLIEGLATSGQPSSEYIKSYDWALRVDKAQQDLITLNRRYDYLYDLFLIDRRGNILYSVAREEDLGTNLFNGPLRHTRFASGVKRTLVSGQVEFSDLERYAPSNDELSGFLSAPILDPEGNPIGAFAMQLRFHRIIELFQHQKDEFISHYIVGEDRLLRTAINQNEAEVLKRKVTVHNANHHTSLSAETNNSRTKAYTYTGPSGEEVIGLQQSIPLPGTNWLLISEVNQSRVLGLSQWLRNITLTMVVLMGLIAMALALYQSKRITRPLSKLADAARRVAGGKLDARVEVGEQNEIGLLAEAFNHMLNKRQSDEEALTKSHQQLQQALTDLNEQQYALDQHSIVAITDLRGTITYANAKFAEISGYSVNELIGHNHRLLKSNRQDRHFWEEMYRKVRAGGVWHNEVCNRAKDGHLYWVDTTVVPFKGTDGKPKSYIAIRTDISHRKKAEQALIEAKVAAEQANRSKSEFLAVMSHEIRTPMNGVLGMLGLLKQTSLSPDQQHKVDIARSSAQSLLTLINDVLDFSKVNAGKLDLDEIEFDLTTLLEEFTQAMAFKAQEKGLELILKMTSIHQSNVKGDPGRIRQILTNLVGNAIKFTHKGEIVIHAELAQQQHHLIFHCSVTDTGVGIPAEKLQQLFDPFTQVDASTTRQYGGTGLGLAIVKQLCELMKGEISVSSELDLGSCFSFSLRLKASELAPANIPPIHLKGLRVLIVDDNATNREVLRNQLEHWQIEVEEAEDADTALALCVTCVSSGSSARRLYDVALLDMQMPEMDGAELAKRIKMDSRFCDIKLVMMTSQAQRGDAKYFSRLGFSAYFPKPATASDLLEALAIEMEQGEAQRQASPLITSHYLHSLRGHTTATMHWPAETSILVVEDNQINQEVIEGMLAQLNLSVDIAVNGHNAIERLSKAADKQPYTLIFMDCQMPVMDGYEASRQIRQGKAGYRYQDITIIAMTANVMEGDMEKCREAGMDDFLGKPLEPDKLLKMLRRWLLGDEKSDTFEHIPTGSLRQADTGQSELTTAPVKVWDKVRALKRLGNVEQRLGRALTLFISEMPQRFEQLQVFVSQSDFTAIEELAHSIKGVAAHLSALRLQQLAASLETAAKEAQIDRINKIMPAFVSAYEQLLPLFEDYGQHNAPTPAPAPAPEATTNGIDMHSLAQLISTLDRQLNQGDYIDPDVVESLLPEIADPVTHDLLKQLARQLLSFDNQEAQHTLEALTNHISSGSGSSSGAQSGKDTI